MEETLFGTVDKVQIAIDRLKAFEPSDGYWLAFSGGKDSVVIKRLAQMAGVKFEAHYSVTSVDPPELVRFIKDVHPDVSFDIPRDKNGKAITMWNLIPKKMMPPTRIVRYCCKSLKESSGRGRVTLTGVRWAESANRKNNQGHVTFTEKNSAKKVSEYTENFIQTNRGGGAQFRQRRCEARRRAMLQNNKDPREYNHRLVRRGRLGVYKNVQ